MAKIKSENQRRPKVAVIHRGAWGDLYISLAALKEAELAHPGAPFVVIGSSKWLEILSPEDWPTLKEICVSENGRTGVVYDWSRSLKCWQPKSAVGMRAYFSDVGVSFNLRTESLRYAWAPLLAGVPIRHGSAPSPLGWFIYTHRAPWLGKDPLLHERDRLLQVVEAPDRIGVLRQRWIETTGLPQVKKPDQQTAERLARAPRGKYILFNPTSSRREKAWPAERFRALLVAITPKLAAHGIVARVIGAPNETVWLQEVVSAEGDQLKNTVVQPANIRELADVVAGAIMLVTNTSSMQFLANGYDVPVLTLMGRGQPEIWGPLGKNDRVIRGQIDARTTDIFASERAAYESISLDEVMAVALSMLEKKTRGEM